MQAIRSILVVVDPKHPNVLALKRAKLIANVTGSHLHLLACEEHGDHSAWLESLIDELDAQGFSATAEQNWKQSPHQTVIAVQQMQGCGLVVKHHLPDNPLRKALLTPEDWKLLRYCPCPVLMTKNDAPWSGGIVLAAVDVGNADGEHKALHAGIISNGFEIAALSKGALHVIAAHPSPMLSAADPTFQLKETIEASYREQCKAFQQEYEISDDRLHVLEGPADVLIPQVASQLRAAVTVIGTVARTGISGALIGNTAEVVLDALESDVLVLKPDTIIDHLEQLVTQR